MRIPRNIVEASVTGWQMYERPIGPRIPDRRVIECEVTHAIYLDAFTSAALVMPRRLRARDLVRLRAYVDFLADVLADELSPLPRASEGDHA